MKKFICLFLSIIFYFGAFSVAAAETAAADFINAEQVDIAQDTLLKLGIIKSPVNYTEAMTRGEFVSLVVGALNYPQYSSENSFFSDVAQSHKFFSDITIAASIGLVSGTSATQFMPEEPIDFNQATKVLVCALGYGQLAEGQGGFPFGYYSVASSKRLFGQINYKATENVSSEVAVMLLYNMLDVDVLNPIIYTDTTVKSAAGEPFLYQYWKIRKKIGIVTGNSVTVVGRAAGLNENHLMLDKTIFKCKQNWDELLGYQVNYYYSDINDENILLYAVKTANNKLNRINADLLVGYSDNKYIYNENGQSDRQRSLVIGKDTNIIYNNVWVGSASAFSYVPKEGYIITIDNMSGADFLMIYDAVDLVVDYYSESDDIIYEKDNNNYLDIDSITKFTLKDIAGNDVSLNSLISYNVVTYYKSLDGEVVTAYVSTDIAEGEISEITDYNNTTMVVADGVPYLLSYTFDQYNKIAVNTLVVGQYIISYMNIDGKIAYAQTQSESNDEVFGYIVDAIIISKIERVLKIRMFNSRGKFENAVFSKNATLNNQKTTIDAIYAALLENGEVKAQVCKYSTNKNGEIINIDLQGANNGYRDNLMFVTAGNLRYGRSSFGSNVIVDPKAVIFHVPNDLEREEYFAAVGVGTFSNATNYNVQIYADNSNDMTACCVVYIVNVDSKLDASVSTPLTLVSSISEVIDEDGIITKKLVGLREGLPVTTTAKYASTLEGVRPGDIIRFNVDIQNKLSSIERVYDSRDGEYLLANPYYTTGSTNDMNNKYRIAKVNLYKRSGNFLKTMMTVPTSVPPDLSEYEMYTMPASPVIVYFDKVNQRAVRGNVNDLMAYINTNGGYSTIIITTNYTTIRSIIIL